ncbi:putative parvulin-type peptidyl-prolyl cis-trans isomerase precursor [Paracoccus haematequi]|uniref:Parvulin-like PPIase n=1 Tax=Paracoccus haematequi TaxID=2491866 RepID=A0A3S4EPU4_9RHOB|nr:peptidylprolyl isomerase [Paracoccus haematequi]VDS07142.1 putative parvulin-type peptidyl-prolyl cis-trans isomerase precursor [Paracoccus haematequi]
MLKTSILAALLATALPIAAMAQDKGADTVVATVDGTPITLGEMIVMKEAASQDPQMAELGDGALYEMMLDQLIQQTAVAAAGKESAGVRAQLEIQRRNTLAASAIAEVAKAQPTDQEIQAAYDGLFAQAEPVTEYSAAHILVDSEEKAREIKAELDGGADFGTLAEQSSTGPSGPNKGDLGWFAADQMVKPFADAVAGMDKGQISDPVQTEFGWHIIKLNDTRLRDVPPLDQVRDQISQMVLRDKVQAEIQRLTAAATVEKTEGIDPAWLSKTDLLEAE